MTPFTRTVDPHSNTVTLRGPRFAVDIITRPQEHTRAGLQVVIDDDANGDGVTTRLHVYGLTGWRELVDMIRMAEIEIREETRMTHNFTPLQITVAHLFLAGRDVHCSAEKTEVGWTGKFLALHSDGIVVLQPNRYAPQELESVEYRPLGTLYLPFLAEPYSSLSAALQVIFSLMKDPS